MPLIPALGGTARQISLSSRPALQSKFQFQDSQGYVSKKKKIRINSFLFHSIHSTVQHKNKINLENGDIYIELMGSLLIFFSFFDFIYTFQFPSNNAYYFKKWSKSNRRIEQY